MKQFHMGMKSSVLAISRAGLSGRQRYLVDTWVSDLVSITTYTIGGTYADVKNMIRLADLIYVRGRGGYLARARTW